MRGEPKIALDRGIDGELLTRVRDAVAGYSTVSEDFGQVPSENDPRLLQVALVLLGPRTRNTVGPEQVVRLLRDAHPVVGIYVVGQRADRLVSHFPALARAGADVAFELDIAGDRDALREHVRSRLSALPPAEAISTIARQTSSAARARHVGAWCLRNGDRHHTVDEVATRFGWDRKTLYVECQRAFGLTVGDLLARGRYLHAVTLHNGGLSYQRIASRLHYASASAVAMLLKRGKERWHPNR